MIRILILLLSLSTCVLAQTFTARASGTITDTSRAAVPGATVTMLQLETNARKTAKTNESGVYTIPLLMPGKYEVTVEAQGMQTQIRRDVILEVNQAVTLDFSLAVAQVATSVDVTADVPMLQSETSNFGTTLETKIIEDYPLAERDVMGMLRSIPGVITASDMGNAKANRNVFDSKFSVGGGRTSTNEVLLDGAANTVGDFNGVVVVPPVDSVQEFRVETSTYSAEFGRTGGGAVNLVTKAGTNKYHGVLFYYHQNTSFNANTFSNNRYNIVRPRLRRHQYGGTLGGPVLIPKLLNGKNKTFFFTSFEGRRENNPFQSLSSVPTAAELSGDFSRSQLLVAGVPTAISIYNPLGTHQEGGRWVRDPFPNNIIPASLINPVAKRVLQEYPAANRPGNAVNRNNYLYSDTQRYSRDVFSGRLDHYFTGKHRLFGRGNWQENLNKVPQANVQWVSSTISVLDNFRNLGMDDTYMITPNLNQVFRYSYTRYRANQFPAKSLGYDPTQLGLPSYIAANANVIFFPNFSMGTFPNLGGYAYNNQPRDTQGFQDQMIWVRNRHTLRWGGEFRQYRFYPFQVFNPTGSYSFGQTQTQRDPLAVAKPQEGFGLASILLGVGNFSYEHVEPLTGYHKYFAAYVQEDYKVTKNLTLNLGLRWETETGNAESHNRLAYFDPASTVPIAGNPKGAIRFTGNGNPTTTREANLHNFGPRVGFAYRVGKKSAVRGGYGLFYLPLGLEPSIVTTPFNYTISATVQNPDYTPRATLSNPFPDGLTQPNSAKRLDDGSYRTNNSAYVQLRHEPAPYIQQWNFGTSRQISKTMVVDVTYYGSRGVHLPIPSMEINQIDPKYLANGGTWLNERVANPYYGQFTTGMLAQATIPREQLLKPYPQFASTGSTANAYGSSLVYYRPPVGDSVYHAATFKFERRFSKGLSVSAHYTISKLLDTGGAGNGAAFTDPSALRDIYNIRLERALSNWDVPQRLVANYSWDLPFGQGRQIKVNRWLDKAVGGWTVMSIHVWESGRPISVTGTDLSRLAGAAPGRVDVVAGQTAALPLSQSQANARDFNPACSCSPAWFNTKAFTQAKEFTIPNGPRNLPNVRTDNVKNWDMTVTKKFKVREGMSVQVIGHVWNLLNQVYFGTPDSNVNSATFGSVTSPANSPRSIEIGAKIAF